MTVRAALLLVSAISLLFAGAIRFTMGGSRARGEFEDDRWAVSAVPVFAEVTIDEPQAALGRVGPMAWLDSNRLAVVDDASQQVVIVDSEGRLLERTGRDGDGPGEFRHISGVAQQGGELVVFESAPGPSRVHRRSANGTWRHRDLRDKKGRLKGLGVLANGLIVATRDGFTVTSPPASGEARRDSVPLGLLGPEGSELQNVSVIGRVWVGYESDVEPGRVLMTSLPLSSRGVAVATPDAVWVCDSASGSCSIFSQDGSARITGTHWSRRFALTSARLDSLREVALADATSEFLRRRIRAQYQPATAPDSSPALESLFSDTRGGVWALSRSDAGVAKELRYLDPTVRVERRVPLPRGFDPRAVGPKGIAGVRFEEDGSERVVILLWRPRGDS